MLVSKRILLHGYGSIEYVTVGSPSKRPDIGSTRSSDYPNVPGHSNRYQMTTFNCRGPRFWSSRARGRLGPEMSTRQPRVLRAQYDSLKPRSMWSGIRGHTTQAILISTVPDS